MNEMNYSEHINFLKDSLGHMTEFASHLGLNPRRLRRILKDLSHQDPFVVYQASIAAAILLDEKTQYH